jgi:uncharacterized membrane protein
MNLERALARILTVGTYLSVVLLALGVGAMVLAGRSPLDEAFVPFDPATLLADVGAGRPEGLLWLGLGTAIATPAGRVAGAMVGFVARRELPLAVIAAAILLVIGLGLVLAFGAG